MTCPLLHPGCCFALAAMLLPEFFCRKMFQMLSNQCFSDAGPGHTALCPHAAPAMCMKNIHADVKIFYTLANKICEYALFCPRQGDRITTGMNTLQKPGHVFAQHAHDLQPLGILPHIVRSIAVHHIPVHR
jgi:hypothetical protein